MVKRSSSQVGLESTGPTSSPPRLSPSIWTHWAVLGSNSNWAGIPALDVAAAGAHGRQRRRKAFLIRGPHTSVGYGWVFAVPSWLCVSLSSPPTQVTVGGHRSWLGPWISCSSLPNTLSQMPSLLPEHLLPKVSSVLPKISGSSCEGANSPPVDLTHSPIPKACAMPDTSPWWDLRGALGQSEV